MAKTLIDLDEDLLARAREILGTSTKKDTVHAALREVVRRAAVDEYLRLGREGAFSDLADPQAMARAWR